MNPDELKQYHAAAMKRRYLALIAAKRCVSCGRRDEDTLSGFARCSACRTLRNRQQNARKNKHRLEL